MHAHRFPSYISCARNITRLAALAAVAAATGCASPPPPPPAPEVDPIADRLKASIVEVRSLPAFTKNADNKAPAPAYGALVTASFQGDAAQLLKRIADARGLELKIRGPKPYLPLIVHVDAVNQPIEEFLKDVGYQFGQRADLVLGAGALEIRYRGMP